MGEKRKFIDIDSLRLYDALIKTKIDKVANKAASDITSLTASLADVATTGSYDDLEDKLVYSTYNTELTNLGEEEVTMAVWELDKHLTLLTFADFVSHAQEIIKVADKTQMPEDPWTYRVVINGTVYSGLKSGSYYTNSDNFVYKWRGLFLGNDALEQTERNASVIKAASPIRKANSTDSYGIVFRWNETTDTDFVIFESNRNNLASVSETDIIELYREETIETIHQLDSKYIPTASAVADGNNGFTTGGQVYGYIEALSISDTFINGLFDDEEEISEP